MGIVPNIHKASHKSVPGLKEKKTQDAQARNQALYPLHWSGHPNYANWRINGTLS